MTVRIYKSTDASAPVLTGQVGKLTDLLDAILVNGYGAKTAAGWTIAYTGTNKRAYLQNLTGANNPAGMHLYVDDNGTGTGGAKEARVCGFETMSAITPTGTGQFPTGAQSTIGSGQLVIRKSGSADATARAWTCIADGQTIYLFTETADTTVPLGAMPFVFGDFFSYKPSDEYAVCIIARNIENSGSSINDPLHLMGCTSAAVYPLNQTMWGHFVARHWTGSGGSVAVGKVLDNSKTFWQGTQGILGGWGSSAQTSAQASASFCLGRYSQNAPVFPNGPDGGIFLSPIYLNHSYAIRGYLAGLWAPLYDRPFGHNDTFTFSGGNLTGKDMIAQNIVAYIGSSANAEAGQVVVETSDTWS